MTGYPRNRYTIGAHFDGGGGVVAVNSKARLFITEDFLIEGWYLFADVSGSVVIDVWADTYLNYPATDADTITGGAEPALSGAITATSEALSAWTRKLDAFTALIFNIDSIATIKACDLYLVGSRR